MLQAATSSTFSALIWWVVPLMGVIGAFGYVLWISRFKNKFETKTNRSVDAFKKFQSSFHRDDDANPPQR